GLLSGSAGAPDVLRPARPRFRARNPQAAGLLGEAAEGAGRIMIPTFDCFVGIDWSGNKQPWQKGLKIAIAFPGRAAPRLEDCPIGKRGWSRTEAIRWIEDQFL